mmetsp:Transcript_133428/g.231862  ORF Transcript_133428/g.231862 Transcript_133428/m.231862 type:complete len:238 (-) Transcript_133428:3405-4118(-)
MSPSRRVKEFAWSLGDLHRPRRARVLGAAMEVIPGGARRRGAVMREATPEGALRRDAEARGETGRSQATTVRIMAAVAPRLVAAEALAVGAARGELHAIGVPLAAAVLGHGLHVAAASGAALKGVAVSENDVAVRGGAATGAAARGAAASGAAVVGAAVSGAAGTGAAGKGAAGRGTRAPRHHGNPRSELQPPRLLSTASWRLARSLVVTRGRRGRTTAQTHRRKRLQRPLLGQGRR